MIATATQFKKNLGHYLDLAAQEDVYVTRHGRETVRISNPARERVTLLDQLVGLATATLTGEEVRADRLASR